MNCVVFSFWDCWGIYNIRYLMTHQLGNVTDGEDGEKCHCATDTV